MGLIIKTWNDYKDLPDFDYFDFEEDLRANLHAYNAMFSPSISEEELIDIFARSTSDGKLDVSKLVSNLEDSDGVLHVFANCYKDHVTLDNLMFNANQEFLSELSAHASDFDANIVMVGSNRQAAESDFSNAKLGKGSCYPRIEQIQKYLNQKTGNVVCNKMLLADVYNDAPHGTALTEAIGQIENYEYTNTPAAIVNDNLGWVFDER